MKRIPEFTFEYDEAVEKGMRIEQLLDQIKHEQE
jgi:ribosome-binding factor A